MKGFHNSRRQIELYIDWATLDSKTPSDGTCLGELLGGFCDVGCYFIVVLHFTFDLDFVAVLHFVSRLLYHVTGTPPWRLRPGKIAFSFSSTASAIVLSGHFLPTGVFYLTLLSNIYGTTCFYQGLPGGRHFFLEVCWGSY